MGHDIITFTILLSCVIFKVWSWEKWIKLSCINMDICGYTGTADPQTLSRIKRGIYVKVLQVGLGNVGGGLEAFVMNYYRELSGMDVQFDFICMYGKIAYEQEIKMLGGNIYYIPNVKKNYPGYVKRFKKILKEGNYDVVHVNMLSAANIVPLRLAHEAGVRKVIAHSHNSSCPGLIRKVMNWRNRSRIKKYATDLFACAEVAGRWLFGDETYDRGEVVIVHNAISVDSYLFSGECRTAVRNEFGWGDRFVVGHVGRFAAQKNHDGILDIFKEVLKKKPDAVLALVGSRGDQYDHIVERVRNEGLEDQVYFLGKRTDIGAFLSAMDVFLFPSLYEGMPFALVEAQANGLSCVIADTISEEADMVPGQIRAFSLDISPEVWAEAVVETEGRPRAREQEIRKGIESGHFEIREEAKRLKELYEE